MSRAMERAARWASDRATLPRPRSPGKWRVATIGARWRGRASHAAPSAAVMWTWTTSAWRRPARARAAWRTVAAARWSTWSLSSERIRVGSPPMTVRRCPRETSPLATWHMYRSTPANASLRTDLDDREGAGRRGPEGPGPTRDQAVGSRCSRRPSGSSRRPEGDPWPGPPRLWGAAVAGITDGCGPCHGIPGASPIMPEWSRLPRTGDDDRHRWAGARQRPAAMSGPEVAVVFPQVHRSGGIERVCWDLLDYLGPRHDTVFVGTSAPEGLPRGVRMVPVDGSSGSRSAPDVGAAGPHPDGAGFARSAAHGDHGVGGTRRRRPVGAECAPGMAGGGPDHPDGQAPASGRGAFRHAPSSHAAGHGVPVLPPGAPASHPVHVEP